MPSPADSHPFRYRLYGLILSSNEPLPGMYPISKPQGETDIAITLRDMPPLARSLADDAGELWSVSPWTEPDGTPSRVIRKLEDGKYFRILYHDGFCFLVDAGVRRVWVTWPKDRTEHDLAIYLLGPIMGTLLRLRGLVCLHASGVEIDGRAVAFLGEAEAGKSTTAAAFAHLGYRVLSDDVVPLIERDGGFCTAPGYPHLRLCGDTVEHFYGRSDALPQLIPSWDKRGLDLQKADRFAAGPLPLGAIYVLQERSAALQKPQIQPMPAKDALLQLVANSYANSVLDRQMRAGEFEFLSRFLRQVPVRSLAAPASLELLPQVCGAVVADLAALQPDHSPSAGEPAASR